VELSVKDYHHPSCENDAYSKYIPIDGMSGYYSSTLIVLFVDIFDSKNITEPKKS
jgi:hypothetical protein